MLYSAALRQGDLDWLRCVNTAFNVAMFGHQNEIFDKAFEEFFGLKPPAASPGSRRSDRPRRCEAPAARVRRSTRAARA